MLDCFSREEAVRLEAIRASDGFAAAILNQLERILTSPGFQRLQPPAKTLLSWGVGKRLLGEGSQAKESIIAVAVSGEPADFDFSDASTVRLAVADLRERLQRYADVEGLHDSLAITIPLATYVPHIAERSPSIDIVTFENWSIDDVDEHLREAFVGEFILRLSNGGVRCGKGRTQDFGSTRQRFLLHASFISCNGQLHIDLSLYDPVTHRALFTSHCQQDRDALLQLARRVSDDVLKSLDHAALLV
jgi:hypothetical protein